MTAHSLVRSTQIRCSVLLCALGVVLLAPGCSNGVGSNCEISQDCASGLTCCTASCAMPARGTCQASCDGVVCTTDASSPDAASSSSEPDAFSASAPDAFSPDAFSPDAAAASEPDAASDLDGGT